MISTQVDRAAFAPAGHDDRAFDDAPLRATEAASGCVVHLSAPSIYAAALEALGLDEVSRWRRQLSFLNLGSGSGYLSALAAALLGEGCVHVCVELDAALAARSRATLAALGRGPVPALRDVQVVCASAFDVDVDLSMKFDRIYVGAGARHGDARRFGRLLKPDGRLVGPFEDDFEPRPPWGLPQALLRVTRPRAPEGSDEFELDDLLPVQFSNLVRPAGDDDDDDDGEYAYAYADSDSEEEDEDDEEAPRLTQPTTRRATRRRPRPRPRRGRPSASSARAGATRRTSSAGSSTSPWRRSGARPAPPACPGTSSRSTSSPSSATATSPPRRRSRRRPPSRRSRRSGRAGSARSSRARPAPP